MSRILCAAETFWAEGRLYLSFYISRELNEAEELLQRISRCTLLRLVTRLALIVSCLGISTVASAQELSFPHDNLSDAAATDATMPALAKQIIALYHDQNREKYLANLYAFQIVAGEYANSIATIKSLRDLQKANGAAYVDAL